MKIFKLLDPRKMMNDTSTNAENYAIPTLFAFGIFIVMAFASFIVWDYGWTLFRLQTLSVIVGLGFIIAYNINYGEDR